MGVLEQSLLVLLLNYFHLFISLNLFHLSGCSHISSTLLLSTFSFFFFSTYLLFNFYKCYNLFIIYSLVDMILYYSSQYSVNDLNLLRLLVSFSPAFSPLFLLPFPLLSRPADSYEIEEWVHAWKCSTAS